MPPKSHALTTCESLLKKRTVASVVESRDPGEKEDGDSATKDSLTEIHFYRFRQYRFCCIATAPPSVRFYGVGCPRAASSIRTIFYTSYPKMKHPWARETEYEPALHRRYRTACE